MIFQNIHLEQDLYYRESFINQDGAGIGNEILLFGTRIPETMVSHVIGMPLNEVVGHDLLMNTRAAVTMVKLLPAGMMIGLSTNEESIDLEC